jgi:hypothetical protein
MSSAPVYNVNVPIHWNMLIMNVICSGLQCKCSHTVKQAYNVLICNEFMLIEKWYFPPPHHPPRRNVFDFQTTNSGYCAEFLDGPKCLLWSYFIAQFHSFIFSNPISSFWFENAIISNKVINSVNFRTRMVLLHIKPLILHRWQHFLLPHVSVLLLDMHPTILTRTRLCLLILMCPFNWCVPYNSYFHFTPLLDVCPTILAVTLPPYLMLAGLFPLPSKTPPCNRWATV